MKIKLQDSDLKENKTSENINKIQHVKTQKIIRHDDRVRSKKIRSLVKEKENTKNCDKEISQKSSWKKTILFSIIAAIFAIVLYQIKFGSCEFWAAYDRNFNLVVYGDKNYCNRLINTSRIIFDLKNQIVSQDDAIELINGSLNLANNHGFIQMILNGNHGIGKSLSSQIIAENFQWKRNIQKFIWDIQNTADVIETAKSKLSKCGFNLIIFDDLEISADAIEFIKNFEAEIHQMSIREGYRVVIINIFKGILNEDLKQDLLNFVIIDYKSFTKDDLIKCIKLQATAQNVILSDDEFEELIEINYDSMGCKTINKRLNLVANKYNKI